MAGPGRFPPDPIARESSAVTRDDQSELVAGVLKGAIDAGDGGTAEQHAVLHAIVVGFLGRGDLDVEALEPIEPENAGTLVSEPATRQRVREMMVLLESCRHPLTEDQVSRVEAYASHIGEAEGPGLTLARDLVRDGAAQALADYMRFVDGAAEAMAEPSLIAEHMGKDDKAPELAARLRGLKELPEGTLGHAYVDFYERNEITFPGDEPNQPAVFVAHDMNHVIAGYEPTGPGEIALGALLLAMSDSDAHWIGFLGNLAIHEAGYFNDDNFEGKTATLARPGAVEMLAEAFARGRQCTGDFSTADHLAMVARPLAEVREEFGVAPARHAQ